MSTLLTQPAVHRGPMMIGLVLAALVGMLPSTASACSCAPPPPPEEAFDTADAVFLATVREIDRPPTRPDWYYKLLFEIDQRFDTDYTWQVGDVTVVQQVDAAWKGVSVDQVAIRTGTGGGDCGFPFLAGRQYLIYAVRYEGRLATSICSRTAPVRDAAEDLDFLADLGELKLTTVKPISRHLLVGSIVLVACCAAVALRLLVRARSDRSKA